MGFKSTNWRSKQKVTPNSDPFRSLGNKNEMQKLKNEEKKYKSDKGEKMKKAKQVRSVDRKQG